MQLPLKKVTFLFPATPNPPLKVEVLSRPPFLTIWLEAQPPPAESGSAHYGGKKWLVNFNAGKTELVPFDRSNNTGAIDVKMERSVLEEKSSFKMLRLTFSSKMGRGSYIFSIAKTGSQKISSLNLFYEVSFF